MMRGSSPASVVTMLIYSGSRIWLGPSPNPMGEALAVYWKKSFHNDFGILPKWSSPFDFQMNLFIFEHELKVEHELAFLGHLQTTGLVRPKWRA